MRLFLLIDADEAYRAFSERFLDGIEKCWKNVSKSSSVRLSHSTVETREFIAYGGIFKLIKNFFHSLSIQLNEKVEKV